MESRGRLTVGSTFHIYSYTKVRTILSVNTEKGNVCSQRNNTNMLSFSITHLFL